MVDTNSTDELALERSTHLKSKKIKEVPKNKYKPIETKNNAGNPSKYLISSLDAKTASS